jgi:hypothetical protein
VKEKSFLSLLLYACAKERKIFRGEKREDVFSMRVHLQHQIAIMFVLKTL